MLSAALEQERVLIATRLLTEIERRHGLPHPSQTRDPPYHHRSLPRCLPPRGPGGGACATHARVRLRPQPHRRTTIAARRGPRNARRLRSRALRARPGHRSDRRLTSAALIGLGSREVRGKRARSRLPLTFLLALILLLQPLSLASAQASSGLEALVRRLASMTAVTGLRATHGRHTAHASSRRHPGPCGQRGSRPRWQGAPRARGLPAGRARLGGRQCAIGRVSHGSEVSRTSDGRSRCAAAGRPGRRSRRTRRRCPEWSRFAPSI